MQHGSFRDADNLCQRPAFPLLVMKYLTSLFLLFLLVGVAATQNQAAVHVNRPERAPFKSEYLKRLTVPAGFRIDIFADNMGEPRMMVVSEAGDVYVSRPGQGDVVRLADRNGDGKVDEQKTIVDGIKLAHGLAINKGSLYICGETELYSSDLNGGSRKKLISNLPDGGQHPKRTIGFGPDGTLYISIGSTCNNCEESNPEYATILQGDSNGSGRKIYAKGLRNTIGFDWHPETRELWGMDHGSDGLGDDLPPDELNHLKAGANYGWPYCYGNNHPDPSTKTPAGTTKEAYCTETTSPDMEYQAHSAPIAFKFYTASQFPGDYRNDAFAAMHGSWNRSKPTG